MAVAQNQSRPKAEKGKKSKGKLTGIKEKTTKVSKKAALKNVKTVKTTKTGKGAKVKAGPAKKTGRQTPASGVKKSAAGKTVILKKKTTAVKKKAAPKKTPAKKREVVIKSTKSAVTPPFRAYSGTKPYIFVSYAHNDMKAVFAIINKLNYSGYCFWYDEGLEPGEEWPEIVGRKIIKCGQFLVFMSPFAVKSRNIRNEINLAFSENKNILVIYLDNTRMSSGLKLQLGSVHFVNKYDLKDEEFFKKLRSALRK